MAYTATSSLGTMLSGLRSMIANCATWQTLCDVTTDDDALPFIKYGVDPQFEGERIMRPLALIRDFDAASGKNAEGVWVGSGSLRVLIELDIPADYTAEESEADCWMWFLDTLGKLRDELDVLQATGSYPEFPTVTVAGASIGRGHNEDPEAIGDYMQGEIEFTWGVS